MQIVTILFDIMTNDVNLPTGTKKEPLNFDYKLKWFKKENT